MGLFDKKYCDICGEKIGLLGNRKLEDGNPVSYTHLDVYKRQGYSTLRKHTAQSIRAIGTTIHR